MRPAVLLACVAALAFAVGCRREPSAPFERSFSLQVRSPRLLQMGEEITVPLAIENAGGLAWSPDRVHVSYHWLWLVPRELLSRSRNVPYQDGIRTDLHAPVASGASLGVNGRLLAPALPGLYWLQWDIVEEGVTWFSQVAPRQPRTLVLVLPTTNPLAPFVPLPILIALTGLYAVGRAERRSDVPSWLIRRAASADVVWAATALLCKPLLLVNETLLEPTAVAYWLMVVVAVVPVMFIALIFTRRARAWWLFALALAGTIVVLSDIIYYRFFGDVLSMPVLLAVGQTPRLVATIRSLLTPRILWLLVDLPFAAWLMVRLRRTPAFERGPRRRPWRLSVAVAATLIVVGVGLSAKSVLASAELGQMFRDRAVMEQIGPYGFHVYDAWIYVQARVTRPPLSRAETAQIARWFAERAPLRAAAGSEYFGVARQKNLIVVQVESLQDFVVNYRVDGQPVMPHLRQWEDDSWRFTNVTDQTNEGRTSDAEFTTMVSLLPLDHGAVSFRYPEDGYVGLPRVLAQHGYSTMSAVAFEPGFWNRSVMHPLYGFSRSYFAQDFTLTEAIGWGLNDRDFLQQMIPRLSTQRKPFVAWLITLSLHHPFESFPDAHKTLKLGALEGTSFGNYLHTMRFFDQALEDFKTSLARSGLLDNTVLAVFGDHDAGFGRDPSLARQMGIGADDVSWELADRVPLFIRVPGVSDSDESAHLMSMPAGQTDLAPTLLGLLGIDPAGLPYLGRNLLGQPGDPPVVRPFGDWIDRTHVTVSRGAAGHACYTLATGALAEAGACAEANAQAREAHDVSKLVISEDLQEEIRGRLGNLLQ